MVRNEVNKRSRVCSIQCVKVKQFGRKDHMGHHIVCRQGNGRGMQIATVNADLGTGKYGPPYAGGTRNIVRNNIIFYKGYYEDHFTDSSFE